MFEWNYIKTREGYPHRLMAEAALGKPLPPKAEVHHMGDMRDNTLLVLCPDRAYHMELHRRMRSMEACGDPNKYRCVYCKEYDDEENLYVRRRPSPSGIEARHRRCHTDAERKRREDS